LFISTFLFYAVSTWMTWSFFHKKVVPGGAEGSPEEQLAVDGVEPL
jgi:hypothetical protein